MEDSGRGDRRDSRGCAENRVPPASIYLSTPTPRQEGKPLNSVYLKREVGAVKVSELEQRGKSSVTEKSKVRHR